MAKCVIIAGRIQRLSDQAAALLVQRGEARYAAKSAWKAQQQDEREDFALETLQRLIREAHGLPGVGHE
ncbi:MAG: hypothetical protein NZN28_11965 [Meiothermus sp.]|uniref:hypothetical protein n=1 Tax=Meiothermus sp. TaxID=1955249 RepID=UPI0025FF8885|nr:hypothetical protein [Meiothermus sp.]MCS7069328.1 hypothetical protein [Meiothermus sp.]